MPEPVVKGVDWEVSVKRRITEININAENLEVVLSTNDPPEVIKQGKITEADFENIKNIVKKVLEAQ